MHRGVIKTKNTPKIIPSKINSSSDLRDLSIRINKEAAELFVGLALGLGVKRLASMPSCCLLVPWVLGRLLLLRLTS